MLGDPMTRVPIVDPNDSFVWQERPESGLIVASARRRPVEPLRSKKFDLTATAGGVGGKILQVIWPPSEIGFMVSSPHLYPRHALVGTVVFTEPPGGQAKVDLLAQSKVSRNPAKVTFHESGQVNISCTGKIHTLRLYRMPPMGRGGHFFTLHVRSPERFESVVAQGQAAKPVNHQIVDLPFEEPLPANAALKLVGWWFPAGMLQLVRHDLDNATPPGMALIELSPGVQRPAIILAPPLGAKAQDYRLLITYEVFEDPSGFSKPYALILGGPGPHSLPGEAEAGISWQSIMVTNRESEIDNLEQTIGSVDLAIAERPTSLAVGESA
jgi:hypothetical protein